jgi:predicted Zn-ribbon and HTH transcriptional regulator
MQPTTPGGAGPPRTRRQEVLALLEQRAWSFEELRHELGLSVKALEDDLRHLSRSLRRGSQHLGVEPAHCIACGFAFRHREPARFHTPGRCPRCRSERIAPAQLRVE